ncbi:MAG: hypothetical protein IKQ31_05030 [Clostridia bacterium]|nr:hypothetical protein [Clostridia bacterium]
MKDIPYKNPIAGLVEEALGHIKSLVDVDTVVGAPLAMGEHITAYPIIKITVGVISGGGQYANKLIVRKHASFPFAGGTGAGFTAEPIGFLIVNKGEHQLITIQNKNAWTDVLEKVGDGLGEYLKNIAKNANKKEKDK